MSTKERIVVAMSGGVDSSTAAALLVAAGHEVVGMAMRLYDAPLDRRMGRCCAPDDLEDARRVAEILGIPFYVVDYAEAFRAAVEDDLVAEYLRGRTPNPCVRCNEKVKFAPLLGRARALGGTLATGHYARIARRDDGAGAGYWLRRAVDKSRDQSYFLFALGGEALEVRFPLGELTKAEVRALARRFGLPVADKPDSQEICFIPDGDVAGFVARRAAASAPGEGAIVDTSGRELGRHPGIHHFTVGQRRGLGNLRPAGGQDPERRFVVRLDPERNLVVVGDQGSLAVRTATVDDVRWPHGVPDGPRRYAVQIRHRHQPAAAWVRPRGEGSAEIEFDQPQRAVAPGQAAVFYDEGDWVAGGGWLS